MAKKKSTNILKLWFVDAFSAMAMGVFATLLIGTIFKTLADWTNWEWLKTLAACAQNGYVVGSAIGVAVAHALSQKKLVIFSAAAVGAVAYTQGGGPLGAYLCAVIGALLADLVGGRTKFDILLVPSVSLLTGGVLGILTGPYIDRFCDWIAELLSDAMGLQPILMGVIVSVVMGLALTAPISSAAIAATVFTASAFESNENLALVAGVATVGCCCQMMGFAVASWRENGFGGFVAQGLGTSMLQVPNILRHPLILIPPTLSSAILGPLAATVMHLENAPGAYGGMGTCGLVGPIGVWTRMMGDGFDPLALLFLLVLCVILPVLLSLLFSEGMRKAGWIKYGDMKLEL